MQSDGEQKERERTLNVACLVVRTPQNAFSVNLQWYTHRGERQ